MFHFYVYHKDSKQLMLLTPKQAEIVNEFNDIFIEAQKEFVRVFGRPWTPDDHINIPPLFDMKKYNRTAGILNKQHAIRNKLFDILKIDVSNEEFDDRLIRKF
jgi:hypothetical protein